MATRAQVIYHGSVQGVGFRYTARALANRYSVRGCVRNLTNGTVELVAEADDAELQSYLKDLEDRMSGFIRSRDVSFQEPIGEFDDFTVRF